MKKLQKLYQKYNNCIVNLIFPLILILYPLIKINQGVDVSDSTYSLGNYLFFDRMEGTWVISTYLSNVVGWLLTKLPFGTTLMGMNLYTGLLVSGLALGMYYLMRKWMPSWIVFVGEYLAISFLWIPTTILYNYLTYVFFALGAMFLYKALAEEKNKLLILAGLFLGLNVWVRIPNLAEMALIVCVWYYCWLNCTGQDEKNGKPFLNVFSVAIRKTGFCVSGYAVGILVPLTLILIQYGFKGIIEMIKGLSQISSGDDSYSIFSMITATLEAYVRTAKWAGFILAGMVMGLSMFVLLKEKYVFVKKVIYFAGIAVLLRFFWGRGMFSFRYYEDYTSMYEWGMIGLYLALAASAYLLFGKAVSSQERLLGMISLVIVCITPLGSNNYTYQNLNNLFVVAPITLYAFVKWFRRRYPAEKQVLLFPVKAMLSTLAFMILMQSTGFHLNFVFRDGMDGTKRNTVLSGVSVVGGMKTTAENAENISGLLEYIQTEENVNEIICFGDCPGLPFLLEKPVAVDSAWPDLDSEPVEKLQKNLEELEAYPTIIIRQTEPSSDSFVAKQEMIFSYMDREGYEAVYENDGYAVYRVKN